MSTLREQFSAVRKAQVETQLDFVRQLTSSVVENTGKVVALNLSTGRSSIEKSTDTLRRLLTATSPRELVDLSTQSQAGFDTLISYGNELFNIASRAQAQLLKSAIPVPPAAPAAAPVLAPAQVEVEVQADVAPPQHVQPALKALPEVAETAPVIPVIDAPADAPAEAAASATEIAEEVPVAEGAAKIKALAQAVSETIEANDAPVLAASPLVAADLAQPVELKVSGIDPVEASAPVAAKPAEGAAPKSRKKR